MVLVDKGELSTPRNPEKRRSGHLDPPPRSQRNRTLAPWSCPSVRRHHPRAARSLAKRRPAPRSAPVPLRECRSQASQGGLCPRGWDQVVTFRLDPRDKNETPHLQAIGAGRRRYPASADNRWPFQLNEGRGIVGRVPLP